jgi:multidrug efflux system outer membrane protein
MRNTISTTTALLGAALLAGCAAGPDYHAPSVEAPQAFTQAAGLPSAPAGDTDERWWRHFGDPVLEELLRDALAHNHDLRLAASRVAEARALRSETRWAFAPGGGAAAGYERTQRSDAESAAPESAPLETWSAGLDAAWEIDLFGRLRRSAEAAHADLGAREADLRAVRVALLSEVSGNYIALRGTEASLRLISGQVEVLTAGLRIARARVEAGRGTPLDTARAEALLHETAALLPPLEADLAVARHRLAVLTGRPPGALVMPAAPETATPATLLGIRSPAEVLRRRPDVARAERELAAATARLGVDTAALFPEVSVRGFFRFVGLDAGDLGDSGTQGWTVAPTVRWSVLDHGRLRSRLAAGRERTSAALAAHERTVLLALEDVENALARYRAAAARTTRLEARRGASDEALALARHQHEAGLADPLAVLDAERTALAAARDATAARAIEQLALISVYRAFGGGWETDAGAL